MAILSKCVHNFQQIFLEDKGLGVVNVQKLFMFNGFSNIPPLSFTIASSLIRMIEWFTEKSITIIIVNGWLWTRAKTIQE